MPWLNWSLKLHIRLRTISLLISTHNIQVYVQWMLYSFVWLYLIQTQRFFSVLGVFGKYFVFTKTEKFQKQCNLALATQSRVIQVACHSHKLVGRFWRLVREWKVQSRGVHKDFHGSTHDSLTSETSSREKHLANFSKLLAWSVLAGETGDFLVTYLSRENRVVCKKKLFFNTILKKGLNFFFLHLVNVHFLVSLSIFQHHCGQL